MIFGGKQIDQLVEDDIRSLIKRGIGEGLLLDYKQQMYGQTDEEKRELAFDLTAFANSHGGFILVGVKCDESANRAVEILGVEPGRSTWVENVCLNRVDSPLIGGRDYRMHEVPVGDGRLVVLVIQILESLRGPHMVTHGKQRYFYLRDGQSKRPASVQDIRRIVEKVDRYMVKTERFIESRQREQVDYAHRIDACWLSMLVVPLALENDLLRVDDDTRNWLRRQGANGSRKWSYLSSARDPGPSLHGFVEPVRNPELWDHRLHVFRNGATELSFRSRVRDNGVKRIASPMIAHNLLDLLGIAAAVLERGCYAGEVRLHLNFANASGFRLGFPDLVSRDFAEMEESHPSSRSEFEIAIDASFEALERSPIDLVRALMDRVFQAFGRMNADPMFHADGRLFEGSMS